MKVEDVNMCSVYHALKSLSRRELMVLKLYFYSNEY